MSEYVGVGMSVADFGRVQRTTTRVTPPMAAAAPSPVDLQTITSGAVGQAQAARNAGPVVAALAILGLLLVIRVAWEMGEKATS